MKPLHHRSSIVAAFAFAAATTAAAAPVATDSINLTGVWEGEQNCDRYDGRNFDSKYKNDTMYISQKGNVVAMAALCSSTSDCSLTFQGIVIEDGKDPERKGQAGFNACVSGADFPYQELVRADNLDFKKSPDQFQGDSQFFEVGDGTFTTNVGTCSWKYKRVSNADPGVTPCLGSAEAGNGGGNEENNGGGNGGVSGSGPNGPDGRPIRRRPE